MCGRTRGRQAAGLTRYSREGQAGSQFVAPGRAQLVLELADMVLDRRRLDVQPLTDRLLGNRSLRGVVAQDRRLCKSDRSGLWPKYCFHNRGMSRWTSEAG